MTPRCTLCRDDGVDRRATRWSVDFGNICRDHAQEMGEDDPRQTSTVLLNSEED